jgi:hypothetical protein
MKVPACVTVILWHEGFVSEMPYFPRFETPASIVPGKPTPFELRLSYDALQNLQGIAAVIIREGG